MVQFVCGTSRTGEGQKNYALGQIRQRLVLSDALRLFSAESTWEFKGALLVWNTIGVAAGSLVSL